MKKAYEGSAAEAADKAIASWKVYRESCDTFQTRLKEIHEQFDAGMEQFKLRTRIQYALIRAGYSGQEPTEENLKTCFLDYVDSGAWSNLDLEQAELDIEDGDITVSDMIQALNKLRG